MLFKLYRVIWRKVRKLFYKVRNILVLKFDKSSGKNKWEILRMEIDVNKNIWRNLVVYKKNIMLWLGGFILV